MTFLMLLSVVLLAHPARAGLVISSVTTLTGTTNAVKT
jgi:hypothetical protein